MRDGRDGFEAFWDGLVLAVCWMVHGCWNLCGEAFAVITGIFGISRVPAAVSLLVF